MAGLLGLDVLKNFKTKALACDSNQSINQSTDPVVSKEAGDKLCPVGGDAAQVLACEDPQDGVEQGFPGNGLLRSPL